MFLAVRQFHNVFAIINGAEFPNVPDTYDARAMDTHESDGIELQFQGVDSLAHQVTAAAATPAQVFKSSLASFCTEG
jgi:hypothetical protein